MAIKTSSAKAKGSKLQQKVRDKLLEAFPSLEADDVVSRPMGSNGSDIMLSPAARKLIPFDIECKKHKTFAVYSFYEQAKSNAKDEPLVVIEADRKKPLVLVDLDYFIKLIK